MTQRRLWASKTIIRGTNSKNSEFKIDSAINDYMENCHHKTLTRKEIEDNVKIVKKIQSPRRLVKTILNKKPNWNVQEVNFSNVLKLFI